MNMEKNSVSTSVEQSKQLLEMGIDPNTASMTWVSLGKNCTWSLSLIPYKGNEKDKFFAYRPAWTLGDLISILPNMIPIEGVQCLLEITKHQIRYVRRIDGITMYRRLAIYDDDSNSTLIDIAVEAIVNLRKWGAL
jgi:hypothetical protein